MPNEKYFETLQLNIKELIHLIKAKSILQSELKLILVDEKYNPGIQEFYHQGGLKEYLVANLNDSEYCPKNTYSNSINSENYNMEWSIAWLNETNDPFLQKKMKQFPQGNEKMINISRRK